MQNLIKQLFIAIILSLSASSCHVARFAYWNVVDIDDYKKFESNNIATSPETFFFKENNKTFKLPEQYCDKESDFDTFLQNHETVAFIIVKSDTILYEKYFNNYNQESVVTTFSIAKSFVSSLIGIAISEGYIDNVNDPITKYLPYIDKEEFADLTIKNLLNMRSGLDANEGYYNPFGDVAKYYYGTNLKKYLTKIKKKETPGKHYEYLSVNTQLLADIIEHTTKKSVSQYLQEKIWEPLQMESDATWSIDSKRNKTVKAYCCINAKARDFAKFGRLYLNKGKWNGKQIVPEEWVYNSSHATNNSKTRLGYFYSYQWRGTDDGAFFARGLLGQYIFVYPKYDFIAIRFGKDYGDVNWIDFFTPIAKEL